MCNTKENCKKMNVQSRIIIVVLIIILIPSFRKTLKHLQGNAACCGGGVSRKRKKKHLGNPISEITYGIEGIHCGNCKFRIENKLNEIEGVDATVEVEKKQVHILLYKEVAEDYLIKTIEGMGYAVRY